MIPDIELQLKCVIKSLKDNVAPAVDSSNQLAVQQLQLSLATLEIALTHLPLAHGVLRRDLECHLELAEKLQEHYPQQDARDALGDAISSGTATLDDPVLGFTQVQAGARAVREAIGIAIAHYTGQENPQAVESLVLEYAGKNLELGRAWNKPMGFEPDPAAVAELDALV